MVRLERVMVVAFGAALSVLGCSDDGGGKPCTDEPLAPSDRGPAAPQAVVGENGCVRLEPVRRFDQAEPVVLEGAWRPGGALNVTMRNGDLEVVEGSAATVRVTFRRFAYLPVSAAEDEVAAALADVDTHVRGGGDVFVSARGFTRRQDADLRVEIPPEFDGYLFIGKEDGELKLLYSGKASAMYVKSWKGSCQVAASPAASSTNVACFEGPLAVAVPEIVPDSVSFFSAKERLDLSFGSATRGSRYAVGLTRTQFDVVDAGPAGCREAQNGGFSCNGGSAEDAWYSADVWLAGPARSTLQF